MRASLAARPALPGRAQIVVARWLAGAALAAGVGLVAVRWEPNVLLAAVLGAVLVAGCELTRGAVRHRRRGALSPRALVVDAHLRAFAARTVAWLQVAAACTTLAWVAAGVPASRLLWSVMLGVVVFAGLAAAVGCLVKASPRPPRSVRRAAASSDGAGLAGTVPGL
jgi:hypothetical protein